jgi:hypothetical protein
MTDVVRLVEYQNKDTVAVLRALLIGAMNGDVVGVIGCVRLTAGREKIIKSGPFRASSASAGEAAARLWQDVVGQPEPDVAS